MIGKRPLRGHTLEQIREICGRLAANQPVRRSLSPWGRLHIDRQLPFLCVYRRPPDYSDQGTDRLVVGEAAYLKASGDAGSKKRLTALLKGVVEVLSAKFGSFLIIEIWIARPVSLPAGRKPGAPPLFTIVSQKNRTPVETIETLQGELEMMHLPDVTTSVLVVDRKRVKPPDLTPLLSKKTCDTFNCHIIGIEVNPVYRNPKNGVAIYPEIRSAIHRGLSAALKQTFFEFSRNHTPRHPPHFHALGRRAVVKAVWDVDKRLAGVSNQIDVKLLVTPTNTNEQWQHFKALKYKRHPNFSYRPLPFRPAQLKKILYQIPVEKVEDPTLADIFEQKRMQLDRMITLVQDRNTFGFLPESLQLYGDVDNQLLETARTILSLKRIRKRPNPASPALNADEFRRLAEEEIDGYRQQLPAFDPKVRIQRDIPGLFVSHGRLLISATIRVPEDRANALIQHEIGTHLLTWHNGVTQPLHLMNSGLPGYEELQEGLAVLSEYLVGGMTLTRLQNLAARVVAVYRRIHNRSFIEIFNELTDEFRVARRIAFYTAMRACRGGGLTKDAIYLQGLVRLLEHLRQGGDFTLLFTGRFGYDHIPVIEELRWRKVLGPPALLPRYLDTEAATEKLERLRTGVNLTDLLAHDDRAA